MHASLADRATARLLAKCLVALLAVPTVFASPAGAAGPSFSCSQPSKDALDRLTCSDGALAHSELRMVQTYYALRQAVGPDRQNALKSEFLRSAVDARARCGMPPVQPGRDQSGFVSPPTAAACVRDSYDVQRSRWAARLSGPAAEEAARPPEANVGLQARLRDLGLLPTDAVVDGVFGTATRSAVATWQRASGRPETGLLGNADAAALLGGASSTSSVSAKPVDPWGGLKVEPLAAADYQGVSVSISNGDVKVTLDPGTSQSSAVCGGSEGILLPMVSESTVGATECKVVNLTLTAGDRAVLTAPVASLAADTNLPTLNIKVAVRKLDREANRPQVVLQGYTGGAHCCTSTTVLSEDAHGGWKAVDLGSMDGDGGYSFLDPARDGSTVLVSHGEGFLYRFASYSGSYVPTRLQEFRDGQARDVTREPRFSRFLEGELRRMEASWRQGQVQEPNGYLAAWVAQKALVGQFEDAWRNLPRMYDRASADGLSACSVDEAAIAKEQGISASQCPNGYLERVQFPQALALFLNEAGYVTVAQAAAVGVDLTAMKARRDANTARYVERMGRTWFVLDAKGACVEPRPPASPADLVMSIRAQGVDAKISVVEEDETGKPVVASVTRQQGGGAATTVTFYRGLAKCGDYRARQQRELEQLR